MQRLPWLYHPVERATTISFRWATAISTRGKTVEGHGGMGLVCHEGEHLWYSLPALQESESFSVLHLPVLPLRWPPGWDAFLPEG